MDLREASGGLTYVLSFDAMMGGVSRVKRWAAGAALSLAVTIGGAAVALAGGSDPSNPAVVVTTGCTGSTVTAEITGIVRGDEAVLSATLWVDDNGALISTQTFAVPTTQGGTLVLWTANLDWPTGGSAELAEYVQDGPNHYDMNGDTRVAVPPPNDCVVPTATPSAAPSATPSPTPTPSPTLAPTGTSTAGPTATPSGGQTAPSTGTALPVGTPTSTPTTTPSPSPSASPTATPVASPSPSNVGSLSGAVVATTPPSAGGGGSPWMWALLIAAVALGSTAGARLRPDRFLAAHLHKS